MVETTSKTARKTEQSAKEAQIRQQGGNFVRDRETGELVSIPQEVKTRIIRVR